jgi:hypothetical protein
MQLNAHMGVSHLGVPRAQVYSMVYRGNLSAFVLGSPVMASIFLFVDTAVAANLIF